MALTLEVEQRLSDANLVEESKAVDVKPRNTRIKPASATPP